MPEPKPPYALTNKELAKLERDYPRGDHPIYRLDLKAEIERRERRRNRFYALTGIGLAALAALSSMIAAIASWATIYLDHHK
jgi:hypothetical protein